MTILYSDIGNEDELLQGYGEFDSFDIFAGTKFLDKKKRTRCFDVVLLGSLPHALVSWDRQAVSATQRKDRGRENSQLETGSVVIKKMMSPCSI
jgi:hypothetical protein